RGGPDVAGAAAPPAAAPPPAGGRRAAGGGAGPRPRAGAPPRRPRRRHAPLRTAPARARRACPTRRPPQRDSLSVGRTGRVSAHARAHRHRRRTAARALRLALWLDARLRPRSLRMPLFATTIAASLPKPAWLAEPNRLWPPWRAAGAALADAKRDATLLALKLQEDCGMDVVTDGEQSRQHFVHGFLEFVEGIDFARKVEIGIRADRYKAMVPTVTGALRLKARVHAREAQLARAHTKRKLKFTLPGPMTIVDTVADAHYGDRTKMAMAFADFLNAEARALEADGVDVIQFDEPAFNV